MATKPATRERWPSPSKKEPKKLAHREFWVSPDWLGCKVGSMQRRTRPQATLRLRSLAEMGTPVAAPPYPNRNPCARTLGRG